MIGAANADTAPNLGKSGKSSRCEICVEHLDSANQGFTTPDSLLFPSEPPDIKNWFSSYEYETLVLETNDNFGFSDQQESKGPEEESDTGNIMKAGEDSRGFTESDGMTNKKKTSSMLIKCKRAGEDDKHENRCLDQASDSPDSPLLSSEPPGIENWFSSYLYESPALDASDDLVFSGHQESVLDKVEGAKRNKVENGENMSVPDKLICNQPFEGQKLKEYHDGSTKDNENSADNQENKLPEETNQESVGTNVGSFESAQILPIKRSCRKDSMNEHSETDAQKDELEANVDSWKRIRRNKNEGHENGFVSIRNKRRENKENLMSCRDGKQSTWPKNQKTASFVGHMKDEPVRRKTLADTTNIQCLSVPEITGKWKCPRKSKPEFGPPLKQLRLGQWFHHAILHTTTIGQLRLGS